MQALYRAHVAVTRFRACRVGLVGLQSQWRGYVARCRFARIGCEPLLLPQGRRGVLINVVEMSDLNATSCVQIQRAFRASRIRLARKTNAIFIQSRWRGFLERSVLALRLQAAIRIQAKFRQHFCKELFEVCKRAARTIQVSYVVWKLKGLQLKLESAGILLRCSVKGALSRSATRFALSEINAAFTSDVVSLFARVVAKRDADAVSAAYAWDRIAVFAMQSCATLIQRFYRDGKLKGFQRYCSSVEGATNHESPEGSVANSNIGIQANYTLPDAFGLLRQVKQSALEAQTYREIFLQKRKAIIVVQSYVRKFISRRKNEREQRENARKRRAAQVLVRAMRDGVESRRARTAKALLHAMQQEQQREASCSIQRCARAFLLRRRLDRSLTLSQRVSSTKLIAGPIGKRKDHSAHLESRNQEAVALFLQQKVRAWLNCRGGEEAAVSEQSGVLHLPTDCKGKECIESQLVRRFRQRRAARVLNRLVRVWLMRRKTERVEAACHALRRSRAVRSLQTFFRAHLANKNIVTHAERKPVAACFSSKSQRPSNLSRTRSGARTKLLRRELNSIEEEENFAHPAATLLSHQPAKVTSQIVPDYSKESTPLDRALSYIKQRAYEIAEKEVSELLRVEHGLRSEDAEWMGTCYWRLLKWAKDTESFGREIQMEKEDLHISSTEGEDRTCRPQSSGEAFVATEGTAKKTASAERSAGDTSLAALAEITEDGSTAPNGAQSDGWDWDV